MIRRRWYMRRARWWHDVIGTGGTRHSALEAQVGVARWMIDSWLFPRRRQRSRCLRLWAPDAIALLTGSRQRVGSIHSHRMIISSLWSLQPAGDYVTVTSDRCAARMQLTCCIIWVISGGFRTLTDSLALPWPLWYLGAWRMQSCYSNPQQLQAAAAAALSFHQHQQRLAFPLMHTGLTRLDQRDQRDDVDDDVTDDIRARLTAERRVRIASLRSSLH